MNRYFYWFEGKIVIDAETQEEADEVFNSTLPDYGEGVFNSTPPREYSVDIDSGLQFSAPIKPERK